MPIYLTTGVPGSGKTLLSVGETLPKLLAQDLVHEDGRRFKRRLMVGGVPDLVIDHEIIDMPKINWDDYSDMWSGVEREPYENPVTHYRLVPSTDEKGRQTTIVARSDPDHPDAMPVPIRGDNWWLWCRPGDVIFMDECQKLFRPHASGRKIAWFIAKLETHRHYGVDFELLTQHPNLLHSNVRQLIGKHRHVRRLLGRQAAMLYEWDQCESPKNIKSAAKRFWKYPRKAFSAYKSSELHTKQTFQTPGSAILAGLAILALPGLIWWAYQRNVNRQHEAELQTAAAQAAQQPGRAASGVAPPVIEHAQPTPERLVFPMDVAEARTKREPYHSRAFVLEGSYAVGARQFVVFGLVVSGQRVSTVTLDQLVRAGYVWVEQGPCAGVLIFGESQRLVTCGMPAPVAPRAVEHPASGPMA